MPASSWKCLRGAIVVDPSWLPHAHHLVATSSAQIFNPDSKRAQCPLNVDGSIVSALASTLLKTGYLDGGRYLSDAVVLHSSAGCARQQAHTDYDPSACRRLLHKPLGVVMALEEGTRLWVADGQGRPSTKEPRLRCIRLRPGDVLVFEGDTVHAGASYVTSNTRVHVYVDVPSLKRRANSTYLVDATR